MSRYLSNFLLNLIHQFQQNFYMKTIKIKMTKLLKKLRQSLINLSNSINSKEVLENKNPKKIVLKKPLTLTSNKKVKDVFQT